MSALVLCSLTVIVTLLWSGIAKARDRNSTAQAIINLRLEQWIPLRLASMTVPWAEIGLALALLLVPGILGSIFALLALLLFVFYWAVIMRAIVQGNPAICNCFGSASSAPVSFYTLFRNTALVLAAVGAFGSVLVNQKSTLGVLMSMDAESWLWTFGAAIIAFLLWAIYLGDKVPASEPAPLASTPLAPKAPAAGGQEEEADEEESPAEGYTYYEEEDQEEDEEEYKRLPIPRVQVYTTEGHRYSLRQLAKTQARVLFLVSPYCGPCHEVVEKLPYWQEKLPMLEINPVVISGVPAEELKLPDTFEILMDTDREVANRFGGATPTAIALGMDGLLAGGPVAGTPDIIQFMDDIMYEMGVLDEEDEQA